MIWSVVIFCLVVYFVASITMVIASVMDRSRSVYQRHAWHNCDIPGCRGYMVFARKHQTNQLLFVTYKCNICGKLKTYAEHIAPS